MCGAEPCRRNRGGWKWSGSQLVGWKSRILRHQATFNSWARRLVYWIQNTKVTHLNCGRVQHSEGQVNVIGFTKRFCCRVEKQRNCKCWVVNCKTSTPTTRWNKNSNKMIFFFLDCLLWSNCRHFEKWHMVTNVSLNISWPKKLLQIRPMSATNFFSFFLNYTNNPWLKKKKKKGAYLIQRRGAGENPHWSFPSTHALKWRSEPLVVKHRECFHAAVRWTLQTVCRPKS